MISTTDRLKELNEEELAETSEFGLKFEPLVISTLLDFPQFCKLGLIRPEHFQQLECRWIVADILNYFGEFQTVPTRDILWHELLIKRMTEDDPWQEIKEIVYREGNPREVPFVKAKITQWLQTQSYARLYSSPEAIEAYSTGDFSTIDNLYREAANIGNLENKEAYGFQNAEDFLKKDLEFDWLVESVMVQGQPMLVGGKKKTLKTGILCDLAISLATGGEFLGKFQVPKPRRVAFFSAESGDLDIQHRLRTIKAIRTTSKLDNLFISFERPKLSDDDHLKRIQDFIQRQKTEVLIIDPLYLTLLTGNTNASSSNLFDMGQVFSNIADICQPTRCTPVLCHHFKKTVDNGLDLDDFTFTGAAEFARQSILIARRGEYHGPENNQLRIKFHGYGRGNTYAVHLNEGTLDNPKWMVTLQSEAEQKRNKAASAIDQAVNRLRNGLLELSEAGVSVTKQKLREELGWSGTKVSRTLEAAVEAGFVEEFREGRQACYRRVS